MSATSTLDDRQFRASIAELSKISGKTYVETFKLAGAGPIIKILAKDKAAKPAAVAAIKRSVTRQAMNSFTGSVGQILSSKDGKMWFRSAYSVKKRLVFDSGPSRGWHLGDREWSDFQVTKKERTKYISAEVARRKVRAGMLRMSFMQIADSMGINLAKVSGGVIGGATKARTVPMPGRLGQGSTTVSGAQFSMVMMNNAKAVRKGPHIGAGKFQPGYWQGALQIAINRRGTAISNDMRRGVFKDIKTRAQRYPGLFVQP